MYFSKCHHRINFNIDSVLTLTEFTVWEGAGNLCLLYIILCSARMKIES